MTTKKKENIYETLQEVHSCYRGETWSREYQELFPPTPLGCINFGYWEEIPSPISPSLREKSQLDLYYKLFAFAEMEQTLGARVIEVGCGRGHGVHLLCTEGYEGYGIDLVPSQIQRCRENYPFMAAKFTQAPSTRTRFPSHSFDFVISVEAAQHFPNFFSFVKEAFRLLKSEGKIAITTFFFPNDLCEKILQGMIPGDLSGTHRAISIGRAKSFLQEAGFRQIEILSIGSKVFPGFCQWALQSMSKKNHTIRWIEAYEKDLIDYYMIKGEK